MNNFDLYAEYYNLFYKDKDYKGEAEFAAQIFSNYSKEDSKDLLNIGCGSGKHDKYLADMGYKVDGFDLSDKMIEFAKRQNLIDCNYYVDDIKTFNSQKKYDYIVSLFHVLSYQTSNQSVNRMFQIVNKNLKSSGVFLFDCWYGPGVLNDPPVKREKEFETEFENIRRIAVPEMDYLNNTVKVHYRLIIFNKATKTEKEIRETHQMRYFFYPEIKLFAEKNNIGIELFNEWMSGTLPGEPVWNVFFCGKNLVRK